MSEENKITIMDVARLSGLSKGTVDRVLHNRGEVSKKSYDKVMKVIKDLGYEPNLYASMLASRKDRTIAVIIPQYAAGEYWELIDSGIARGREFVQSFNIKVNTFFYDQYSLDSFREACAEAMESAPSGVVLAPLFRNGTSEFTAQLQEQSIPYVFIDSKLEEEGYLAYFGMPMYRSGYLCADLLTGGGQIDEVAMVRIERDKKRQSDPTVNRRAGFMDYMLEHCPDCSFHTIFINPRDPVSIEQTLDSFAAAHPGVKHIAVFSSRVYLIVDYLEKHDCHDMKVIGYDDLSANVAALKRGTVDFIITQHASDQAFMAISTLNDLLVHRRNPARRDNYMHMDILTRYNAD